MSKNDLPTYAIVELLIRLLPFNPTIGNYKDHYLSNENVIVKTAHGPITLPHDLVIRQFNAPEDILDYELKAVALQLK
jgi:hypothetical protein